AMRKLSRSLAHALAAEYVVGTLRGRARQRFEAIARADAEVAAITERWETELTALAARLPAVEPPARVWRRIEAVLQPRASAASIGAAALSFWRTLGLAAGGLAAVLLAVFLWLSPTTREEALLVAVLTAADAA